MNIQQIVNNLENSYTAKTNTMLNSAIQFFRSNEQVKSSNNALPKIKATPSYTFLGYPEEDTILSKNLGLSLPNAITNELTVWVCMYRRIKMDVPVISTIFSCWRPAPGY